MRGKAHNKSKAARLAAAIVVARAARDTLAVALGEVDAIRQEYQDWYDTMSEGWQDGEKGCAVQSLADIETEPGDLLSEVDTVLDDLEAEIP